MASLVGKTVARYRVVARLGRGGMAEVYKAYQPGLDRYVAIKSLHSHLVEDADFIGRFEREAHAIGKLRHPNIVQALDFDREGDMYFMAMEFIDGPTLKEEAKARKAANKPFSLKEVARIFIALCSAIDYAHARGMVHRDLKPANVMINQQGQVVLTDFGIARIMGATQYTQTGALSGTPAYMSPEQGQGERADERSDIYSLGVMLYEMVTGMVPYDADTPFAVIMKHINEPLPMPRAVNPNIPEAVELVILKAMSKDPGDRYQTARDMAKALREAVDIKPGEENIPLTTVAPRPKIQEIEHSTGPITAEERAASAAAFDRGATAVSPGTDGTMATPAKRLPLLSLTIGGGIAALLILVVIIIGIAIVVARLMATPTKEAASVIDFTATAQANALTTAEAEANASATAVAAEAAVSTQTVMAATVQAEQTSAKQTADAQISEGIEGALAQRDATSTAAAQEAIAAADTATAEFLTNVTPTPIPTTPPPTIPPTPAPLPNTPEPSVPADTPAPETPALSGKLAFPVDDGAGKYDVYIVSMPDGKQLGVIKGARQPNFRSDGAKLLVNGEGGSFGQDVFEASFSGSIEKAVTGSPTDSYPVYNPEGGRIAYSNPQLALGSDGSYHPYIFVQCGLIPPSQEGEQTCNDIARFGILVPDGQIGEIQGSSPVWASNDHIIYKGCNSWAGGSSCGVFIVASWANKRDSKGETPRKLADGTSLIPTDTKGSLVAFHSRESGDWEAYVMGLDGGGVVNISNSPNSSDGVPTISPDGQWVAFASDREGKWAIYVAPATGGQASKLFDFPKPNPWATGDRDWTSERMSWGP
jgi:hypothetical protein